jgi:acetyltransferase-like isoleucine patch superfamily enzyme
MKMTLSPTQWAGRFQRGVFYLLNRRKFHSLGLGSFITRPVQIEGSRHISLGRWVRIRDYAWLAAIKIDEHEPELIFGEACSLGYFNHIAAVRRVELGPKVLTANNVYISDNLHGFDDIHAAVLDQPVRCKATVHIGEGTWLGEHVCVIGANVGRHCVIGANAVVSKDIPDYSVAVGTPARVIQRFIIQTQRWEKVE